MLLLDEPFAALDELTTHDLLGLVLDWHRQGRTVIAVLHELDQVEHFPLMLADGPRADRLGSDSGGPHAGQSAQGPRPCSRLAWRGQGGATCHGDRALMSDIRPVDRSVDRLWLHGAGTGRLLRAVARLRVDRHTPGAPADEPDGRRHVACDPAGRGARLSGRRLLAVVDEPGRAAGRLDGGDPRRRGVARHDAQGGCQPCRLLSDVAGGRRADHLEIWLQYRSPACAVRDHSRGRHAEPSPRQHHRLGDAADAGGDLPAADLRMFRSRVPPDDGRRRLGSSTSSSSSWWCSIWWRDSRRSAR